MYCAKCGAQLPDRTAVCPYCGEALAAQPKKRPFEPLLGMILGIAASMIAFAVYFFGILTSMYGVGVSAVLYVLTGLLGVAALAFSILGLKKSLSTGGRNYVAGIVFSSVGLACALGTFLLLALCFFASNLFRFVWTRPWRS